MEEASKGVQRLVGGKWESGCVWREWGRQEGLTEAGEVLAGEAESKTLVAACGSPLLWKEEGGDQRLQLSFGPRAGG